jgi:hypothetical protein
MSSTKFSGCIVLDHKPIIYLVMQYADFTRRSSLSKIHTVLRFICKSNSTYGHKKRALLQPCDQRCCRLPSVALVDPQTIPTVQRQYPQCHAFFLCVSRCYLKCVRQRVCISAFRCNRKSPSIPFSVSMFRM